MEMKKKLREKKEIYNEQDFQNTKDWKNKVSRKYEEFSSLYITYCHYSNILYPNGFQCRFHKVFQITWLWKMHYTIWYYCIDHQ